ncbi:MAG: NTP transferase domain-containing protein, partial [Thermoguttaceae bacterium]
MNKIVILARGLGTRMRRDDAAAKLDGRQAAIADTGVKAMIPIGRPFLDYVLSAAADAGYRHACLVVGPEQDAIRKYYSEVPAERLDFTFANQEQPRGTADAVAAAEQFADGDPIAVINSDNYYPVDALRRLREQSGSAVALFERDAMLSG